MKTKFKKDYKTIKKRGLNVELLQDIIDKLAKEEFLLPKYKDHALIGKYDGIKGVRDCHVFNDWVLLYQIIDNRLILIRTGTHTDLEI